MISILQADALHIPLADETVQTVVKNNGQFKKGQRAHPETEFKKGEHWRKHQPYWDRDWLYTEYINKQRSSAEIANDFGITEASILFWLKKHKIPRRTISQARAIKHWGLPGEKNGMFGKTGVANPNWLGGITPERQALYSSREWANAVKIVWRRDKATCQRCLKKHKEMHVHHLVSFAVERLRTDPDNLILLCVDCHRFVHGLQNINGDFIRKEVPE